MALDMKNATIAVSNKGTTNMANNISNAIVRMGKVIEIGGKYYSPFINTVNNNWSGASRDAFVKDLNKKITQVQSELKTLANQVQSDLNSAKNAFVKRDANIYQAK